MFQRFIAAFLLVAYSLVMGTSALHVHAHHYDYDLSHKVAFVQASNDQDGGSGECSLCKVVKQVYTVRYADTQRAFDILIRSSVSTVYEVIFDSFVGISQQSRAP